MLYTWTTAHPECLAVVCRIEPLMVQVPIKPLRFTNSEVQYAAAPGFKFGCLSRNWSALCQPWSRAGQAAATLQRACFAGAVRARPCHAWPTCLTGLTHRSSFTQEKIWGLGLTVIVIQYFVQVFILAYLCSFAIFFLISLQLKIWGLYPSKPFCCWIIRGAFPESGLHQTGSLKIVYCSIFTSATETVNLGGTRKTN